MFCLLGVGATGLSLKLSPGISNPTPPAGSQHQTWHHDTWKVELGKISGCSTIPCDRLVRLLAWRVMPHVKVAFDFHQHSPWHELFLLPEVTKVLNVKMTHSCTLEQSTWVSMEENSLIVEGFFFFFLPRTEFNNVIKCVNKSSQGPCANEKVCACASCLLSHFFLLFWIWCWDLFLAVLQGDAFPLCTQFSTSSHN